MFFFILSFYLNCYFHDICDDIFDVMVDENDPCSLSNILHPVSQPSKKPLCSRLMQVDFTLWQTTFSDHLAGKQALALINLNNQINLGN